MEFYKLGQYIDEYSDILPSDTQVLPITNDDWYIAVKSQFNDIAWMYYYEREMLNGSRFPYNEPDISIENIKRCIAIYLIQNRRRYERIFNAYTADFNPLWNVDGVTGTVSEGNKRGYDELQNRGNDTTANSGKDSTVRTGNETHAGSGHDTKETEYDSTMTKNGTRELENEGQDIDTKQVSSYESQLWLDQEKNTKEFNNRKDTETFTALEDAHEGKDTETNTLGTTITDTYNNVKDETTHGLQTKTEYNSDHKTVYNSDDKFVEMVIRQGNIGVTRSDELITHAIELFNSVLYDFFKMVVRDCVNQITYRIY